MVAQVKNSILKNAVTRPLFAALQVTTRLSLRSLPILFLVLASGAIVGVVGKYVIWPGYVDPQSRMYTSRLGYAALLRQQGKPFAVSTVHPEIHPVSKTFVGEGMIRSQPILVPIVPMSRIVHVHVALGDRVDKGQLLVESDDTKARIKVDAARIALEVAKADFERTRIGSVYVLEDERPKHEAIRVQVA